MSNSTPINGIIHRLQLYTVLNIMLNFSLSFHQLQQMIAFFLHWIIISHAMKKKRKYSNKMFTTCNW